MPTDLPTPPANTGEGPVKLPKRYVQIDHDVILPEPRPSDEPDAIMPGDREADGAGPPTPAPALP